MAAFTGTAATSTVVGVGVVADWITARQVGSLGLQRAASAVALRVGANGVLTVVGGVTFTASGLGLVLLGAGVLFQVGAMVLTPTPLQKWASRSYFGKGSDKFPQGDWKAEHDALKTALEGAAQTDNKIDATPAAQISDIVAP